MTIYGYNPGSYDGRLTVMLGGDLDFATGLGRLRDRARVRIRVREVKGTYVSYACTPPNRTLWAVMPLPLGSGR